MIEVILLAIDLIGNTEGKVHGKGLWFFHQFCSFLFPIINICKPSCNPVRI